MVAKRVRFAVKQRASPGAVFRSFISDLSSFSRYAVPCVLFLGICIHSIWPRGGARGSADVWPPHLAKQSHPTLVIYVYSGSDPEYAANLAFFVQEAVQADDGCDYVFVLQQDAAWRDPPLAPLPPNARYLRHPNECFDLGTVGWVLRTQVGDISRYRYFVWVNSSVRGPFLPPYLRGRLHWTRPFTSKLEDPLNAVKLVGATISCGGALGSAPAPHVQSYAAATDSTGLNVLLGTPGVLDACWKSLGDVVLHSEIGASTAILDAGFGIDSLQLRYQGLDWRRPELRDSNAPCNAGLNPLQPGFNDGADVDPFEVLFVKVKAAFLEAEWRHAVAAVAASRWVTTLAAGNEAAQRAALRNAWADAGLSEAAAAKAERRGQACFDAEFYLTANANDLGFFRKLEDPEGEAWDQFLEQGVYEGRPHRWKC